VGSKPFAGIEVHHADEAVGIGAEDEFGIATLSGLGVETVVEYAAGHTVPSPTGPRPIRPGQERKCLVPQLYEELRGVEISFTFIGSYFLVKDTKGNDELGGVLVAKGAKA